MNRIVTIIMNLIKQPRQHKKLAKHLSEWWIDAFLKDDQSMGPTTITKAIKMAAMQERQKVTQEQLNIMQQYLEERFLRTLKETRILEIHNKYDAEDLLLEALEKAGIDMCQGAFPYFTATIVRGKEIILYYSKDLFERYTIADYLELQKVSAS